MIQAGYVFFLQCHYIHILHESLKKIFYCLNIKNLIWFPVVCDCCLSSSLLYNIE